MTTPTPDQFAALVARVITELTEADTDTFAALVDRDSPVVPRAFAGCPWLDARVDRYEASQLLQVGPATVTERIRTARLHRADPRWQDIPLPGRDGTWPAGALVMWQAIRRSQLLKKRRWPPHSLHHASARQARADGLSARQWADRAGISRELATMIYKELGFLRHRPGDAEMLPLVRQLTAGNITVRIKDVIDHLAAAGYTVGETTASRLRTEAGGLDLRPVEPDTKDGWVRPATIRRAAGCSSPAVTRAIQAGWLTPWARDSLAPHGRGLLFDIARIKPGSAAGANGASRIRAAVDADWEPGGGGEVWLQDGWMPENKILARLVWAGLLARAGDRAVTVPEVIAYLHHTAGVDVPEKRAGVLLALAMSPEQERQEEERLRAAESR